MNKRFMNIHVFICIISLIIPYYSHSTPLVTKADFSAFNINVFTINSINNTENYLQISQELGFYSPTEANEIRSFLKSKNVDLHKAFTKMQLKGNVLYLGNTPTLKIKPLKDGTYRLSYKGYVIQPQTNLSKSEQFKSIYNLLSGKSEATTSLINTIIEPTQAASVTAKIKGGLLDSKEIAQIGLVATAATGALGSAAGPIILIPIAIGLLGTTAAVTAKTISSYLKYAKVKCGEDLLLLEHKDLSYKIQMNKEPQALPDMTVLKNNEQVKSVKLESPELSQALTNLYYQACTLNKATAINDDIAKAFEAIQSNSNSAVKFKGSGNVEAVTQ